jgi:hypothetical protein
MEKCKVETPVDGNSTENEDGQMPAGQVPNENEAIAPVEEVLANPYKRYKCRFIWAIFVFIK